MTTGQFPEEPLRWKRDHDELHGDPSSGAECAPNCPGRPCTYPVCGFGPDCGRQECRDRKAKEYGDEMFVLSDEPTADDEQDDTCHCGHPECGAC